MDEAIADFTEAIKLKPDDYTAYNGRSDAYAKKGNNERAAADKTKAIELWAGQYVRQGIDLVIKGDVERGTVWFDQIIKEKPDFAPAYYNRGWARLYSARGGDAAADTQQYLKLAGWREPFSQYAALVGHFGLRQAGRAAEADALLEQATTQADASAWPHPIINYLRRKLSAQELLARATDNDKLTEARAYIGMDLSLAGRRDEALAHLRWVKEKGNQAFYEYHLALSEIKRIEAQAQTNQR